MKPLSGRKKKAKWMYHSFDWTFSRYLLTYLGIIGVLCILFALGTFALTKFSLLHTPLENDSLETPKNEMHKLPLDVKKNLQQQPTRLLATLRVPILMYHYVEYVQDKGDKIRQSLDVTPDVFESQVQTLQNAGYAFMTAKELGDALDGKTQMPPKPVLLTFDDGHWDFATVVLPILEKYHIKATAYIISGFLGGSDFMTPQELQTVIDSGLVDVGAHTVHHIPLKGVTLQLATTEIQQSKSDLENMYHIRVVSFAYPFGSFDQQAVDILKKAKFTTAVSTIPGIEQNQLNRLFLYRIRPGYRTGQDLLTYLNQDTFKPY